MTDSAFTTGLLNPGAISEMFFQSPEMMVLSNFSGMFIHVNRAFVEKLGRNKETLLGKPFMNFVYPEDQDATAGEFRKLMEGKSRSSFQNRYLLPSGGIIWLEWSSNVSMQEQLIFSVVRDVSEQKRNEQAIYENNLMLSTVSRTLSDFIVATHEHNPFNTLLEQLLELTHSEYGFIGEVLQDEAGRPYLKSHALTNIAWDEQTRRFYDDNAMQGLEFRNLNTLFGHVMTTSRPVIANDAPNDPRSGGLPPGHPPLHAFLGLPIHSGPKLIGMLGIANRPGGYQEDLMDYLSLFLSTCSNLILSFRAERERRNTLVLLRQAEAHNRAIVEAVDDGIFTLAAGNKLDFFNPALSKMLGRIPEQIAGLEFAPLIVNQEHRDALIAFLAQEKVEKPLALKLETEVHRPDGTTFPAELSLSVAPDRQEVGVVGVIRDITQQQQSRADLLRAKQVAEDASRAKGQFLANMSHEIRTPLNGLVGMVDLALETNPEPLLRDFLLTAKESAGSLSYLINDILDFSKIEAGKLSIEKQVFNFREHLDYIIQHFSPLALEKGILLEAKIDSEIPEHGIGDALRIRQVMLNLLSNAIKFTLSGRVEIELSCISSCKESIRVRYMVRDTGIGISADKQSQIFDAFEQGDSSITRRFGGTGLGLSISRALVNLMNGQIQLQSVEGQGSCFWFDLELDKVQQTSSPKHPDKSAVSAAGLGSGQKALRILLAEDNHVNQKLFSHLLQNRGHTVRVVNNGQEALQVLEHEQFDVVLMDLQMPIMGGLEACRLLREREAGKGIRHRVIALTAHAMSSDREKCLAVGMDEYLAKPVQKEALLRMVEG